MISNVINNYDVNFIMPISKIDENMERAHKRDGVLDQKFWFRTKVTSKCYRNCDTLKKSDYLLSNCKKQE